MNRLQLLLIKLRLFDADTKVLSLTSILLMVAIGRLAFFPADVYTVSILTLALAHANLKRLSAHKRKVQADKQADVLETEKSRVDSLADEVKKLVQASNISKLGR